MKIFQGIRNPDEIEPLVKAGASEFYTGFTGREFSLTNHYEPCYGIESGQQLKSALERAHALDAKLFVAVNNTFYGDSEIQQCRDSFSRLMDMGVDGFILASLPLLLEARNLKLNCEICLSTLQPVFNTEAYEFFLDLGIQRIVFPEHVSAGEVERILRDPRIKTEAFFHLSHDCTNIEAFCLFHHQDYKYLTLKPSNRFDHCRTKPHMEAAPGDDVAQSIVDGYEYKDRFKINHFGNLYDFHRLGLDYLKMGNRPLHLEHKLLMLDVASKALAILERETLSRVEFLAQAEALMREVLAQQGYGELDTMYEEMYKWYYK